MCEGERREEGDGWIEGGKEGIGLDGGERGGQEEKSAYL